MPEALEANQRGELSADQLRGFRALSRYTRRNTLTIGMYFVAGAFIVGFFATNGSPAVRFSVTVLCLAVAAWLVVRSITGSDRLTRDLRDVKVQSVEGAIGKSRLGGKTSTYFLEVGNESFTVSPATFDTAPAAGIVRLYFLPRSRKIVNLERLPNVAPPTEFSATGIVQTVGAALLGHDQKTRNEARAGLATVGDALDTAVVHSPTAPTAKARDPRPLEKTIVGTWKSALMTVTFSPDGCVTTRMLGGKRDGHWSIDPAGRLRSDVIGQPATADAWIAGDQLTISADGVGMTFTRVEA
jgi:hypothetical protein